MDQLKEGSGSAEVDDSHPSTSKIEGIKKRKIKMFNSSWLEMNEFKYWLTSYSNEKKAYCIVCDKILVCGKSELRKHASRNCHIENINKNRDRLTPASLPTTSCDKEQLDHINKVKVAEIKLAAFYAEHDIKFQTIDHMISLIKDVCSDPQVVKDLSLTRRKCTHIIKNVIRKHETEKTILNLRYQKFSVLLNERTIANDKLLYILVKYVSPGNKKCITELLELVKLDATDYSAEKLYSAFEHCFKSKEIPLANIIGLACDNASVMIGTYDSFITRLKKEIPNLVVLKCTCHSSTLVASQACSKLPDSCETLLHAVATYTSSGTKRSAILFEFQDFFRVESRKILNLSDRKWLVLQTCVTKLLDNWEVLKHYFYLEATEAKNDSAQTIVDILNDNVVKVYMLFLKYSLNFFNNFNALFQSKKILLHKLSESSEQLIRQIGQNFLLPAALKEISADVLHPRNFLPLDRIYVGSECEILLEQQTSDVREEVKSKCLDFYVTALDEMIRRLPFDDVVLRGLRFLDPKFALYNEGRNAIRDLTDIATRLGTYDITALAFEWRVLPTTFNDADKETLAKLETGNMWEKIFEKNDFNDERMFPNLEQLVDVVLALPHSNAEAERIFSITDVKNNKKKKKNHIMIEHPYS